MGSANVNYGVSVYRVCRTQHKRQLRSLERRGSSRIVAGYAGGRARRAHALAGVFLRALRALCGTANTGPRRAREKGRLMVVAGGALRRPRAWHCHGGTHDVIPLPPYRGRTSSGTERGVKAFSLLDRWAAACVS